MNSFEDRTLYQVLEVNPEVDIETIRASYHRLVRIYHPSIPETGSEQMFQKINGAWLIMCDQERRTAYDKWLADTT